MKCNTLIALLLLCLFGSTSKAQNKEIKSLKPGEMLPEIIINNVLNSNWASINLSQYKGKVLIIDFWGTYCGACVANMPKVNGFQKEFGDKVQFLLVSSEPQSTIETYQTNVNRLEKLSLKMPLVYNDTFLKRLFPYRSIPHYVWIDANGVFKMATDAFDLTRENLVAAINGNYSKLVPSASTGGRLKVDIGKPFFNEQMKKPFYQNEGKYDNIRYKISITGFIDSLPGRSGHSANYTGRILNKNTTITALYKNAYSFTTGKMVLWPMSKIEVLVKDKWKLGIFNKFEDLNLTSKEYYEKLCVVSDLVLPDFYKGQILYGNNVDSLRAIQAEILKIELKNCFPYYTIIEKKNVKCFVLKTIDSSLYKSKGGKESFSIVPGYLGATFNNKRISDLCLQLELWMGEEIPIIDETEYLGKIDLILDAPLQGVINVSKINTELQKHGIAIVEENRVVDFLVIRDK